ncbi:MAG: hypothetical protein ACI9XR_001407 [Flavobacterium sp.]|jgi:hypothetical protein
MLRYPFNFLEIIYLKYNFEEQNIILAELLEKCFIINSYLFNKIIFQVK